MLQVLGIASAAAEAVATDRAALRRLLQLCLPADLLASLDIEALLDAMIASTAVDGSVAAPGSGGNGTGTSSPSPPSKAATISLRVTQELPQVPASSVDATALGRQMAQELNRGLAAQGLTAEVTATATDASGSSTSGRRLQQSGGAYGGGCTLVYIITIAVPPGQAPSSVTSVARSVSLATARDEGVLQSLLEVGLVATAAAPGRAWAAVQVACLAITCLAWPCKCLACLLC
jgi:hypothetical protein